MDSDSEKEHLLKKHERLTQSYTSGITFDKKQSGMRFDRPVYRQSQVNVNAQYEKPKTRKFASQIRLVSKSWSCKKCLWSFFPIIFWLPRYNVRDALLNDIFSGITVATMHIPQGIAYALLANVPPVVGLYMAFFPVLTYVIFASSRHTSMGTFAVVCLMTGRVVSKYSADMPHMQPNGTKISGAEFAAETGYTYTSVEVATAVTFLVAIYQFIFYLLRLGKMTTIMSDTMVNAFTTAAAIHVVVSQLKELLGLHIRKRAGFFRIVFTMKDVVLSLPTANVSAIVVSAIAMAIMIFNNEALRPKIKKKTKFVVPIELIAVILGVLISRFWNFEAEFDMNVVGDIPTGFPVPRLPTFGLLQLVYIDAFLICVVSYCISISMAMLFADKAHYELDTNQELLAMGMGNWVGSIFMCPPITASLSRSTIQFSVGGKTQLASLVSCAFLSIVLVWLGPYLAPLPKCIVASIVIVALKGMIWQIGSIGRYWRLSKWDAAVWILTVLVTVFIDISVGLLTGFSLSLVSILVQGLNPYSCLLANLLKTDLYLDQNRYKETQPLEGVKIYHYSGALNFSTRSVFKNALAKHVGFDVSKKLAEQQEEATRRRNSWCRGRRDPSENDIESGQAKDNQTTRNGKQNQNAVANDDVPFKIIILDFSSISYIDPAGVEFLRQLAEDFSNFNIEIYIAAASSPVREMFSKCDIVDKKTSLYSMYPTIHDAALSAEMTLKSN